MIDLSRFNAFLLVESNRASLIPGEWVSSIDLSDAYLHIPIHPNSRKSLQLCYRSQVFQFTSLPFGLATTPQIFTMLVKEVKMMALTRGIRFHQYLDDWLIRAQSQEEAQVNTQTVVDLTQSLGWIINSGRPDSVLTVDNKSGEIRTKTCSSVFVRGLRIPSRFSPCKTHSREMAQTSGFDPMTRLKHVLTARCLMSLIGLLTSMEKVVPEGRLHVSSPRPKCLGHRCSNINWLGLTVYAYPPMALLHRVIQKIRQCNCLIIVIVSGWPGMPWFWDLVQLSTEIPLQLPVSTTLLK